MQTETVASARLAKQEKTRRVVHSGKLYDVELGHYNNQQAQEEFTLHPPCEQKLVVPMGTRLLKLLVFLFEVEQMYDPPHHTLYDSTLEEGPRDTGRLWEEGPAVIVWDDGPDDTYSEKVPHSRRALITITKQEALGEPWVSIGAEAAVRNRYPVTCKSHRCVKILTVLPTTVYLHAPEPI